MSLRRHDKTVVTVAPQSQGHSLFTAPPTTLTWKQPIQIYKTSILPRSTFIKRTISDPPPSRPRTDMVYENFPWVAGCKATSNQINGVFLAGLCSRRTPTCYACLWWSFIVTLSPYVRPREWLSLRSLSRAPGACLNSISNAYYEAAVFQ